MKTPVAAIAITLAALPLIVVSADTTASTSAEVEVLKGRIETLERELATLRNQVFREVPWTNQNEVVVDTVNGLTYTGAVRTINVCNFQMLMDCDPVRQEDRDTIRSNRLSRIRGRQSNLGGLRRPGPSVSTSTSTNSAGRAATPLLGSRLSMRRPHFQMTKEEQEKMAARKEEQKRIKEDERNERIKYITNAKIEQPGHYEFRLNQYAEYLDKAEENERKYPLNYSNAYNSEVEAIEERYGRDFLNDVLEYRRKKREKESAK